MTRQDLRANILSLNSDIEFKVLDEVCDIMPVRRDALHLLAGTYGDHLFSDVDELLSAPVFNGKSIADLFDVIDWDFVYQPTSA